MRYVIDRFEGDLAVVELDVYKRQLFFFYAL